jgi:hypothetical protein
MGVVLLWDPLAVVPFTKGRKEVIMNVASKPGVSWLSYRPV